MQQLEADYLVIGSGAVGMAFVDTMLDETDDTSFVIVDRHHLPGGHWNDAYPFVRLHQPSAYYGVASTPLGQDRIDETGSNKGFFELASGAEVLAYFEQVMRERFLPSGRVQYFPMCSVDGDGQFSSLLSDKQYVVNVRRKTVDGTFFNTSVPATHTRKFKVDPDVTCIAPNELPVRAAAYRRFTVLGGGKTAMDALVWLLDHGADPDAIRWVCPRTSWLINRNITQPGLAFLEPALQGFAAQIDAMCDSDSVKDLFSRLETANVMLRIDSEIEPTMYHYATLSEGEAEQLGRIDDVVRGRRVDRVHPDKMVMEDGSDIAADPDTLYVDCTAIAVTMGDTPTKPVFEPDRITPQAVFAPLVSYSAAIVAYVEANFDADDKKNSLCRPIQLADTPAEWMRSTVGNMMNQNAWSQEPDMRKWLTACRLNPMSAALMDRQPMTDKQSELLAHIGKNAIPAVMNVQKLMAAL